MIWIGYDRREPIAWHVCASSIRRFWRDAPIGMLSLDHPVVKPIMIDRPYHWENGQRYCDVDGKPFSTDFSFSRFLVPFLERYTGWHVFVDSDFLFRADIRDLLDRADDERAAMVVQHHHAPPRGEDQKMDAQIQTRYHRKNWSSLILWNCGHPSNRAITPTEVKTREGSWLHGFEWLKDEEIGEIAEIWNWLEGISPTTGKRWAQEPQAIHFTRGGPWFSDYRDVEFAEEWRDHIVNFTPERIQ